MPLRRPKSGRSSGEYEELLRLPYDERWDDGAMILAVTLEPWGGEPLCVDC
jgi:hypothetical protein